jgi:carboxylate-amine ligase
MFVDFHTSPRSTIGLEWELHVIDRETLELAPASPALVKAVGGGKGRPIRPEYLACAIEIVSDTHTTVRACLADLRAQLDRLLEAAASFGVTLIGAGSHPFSHPADQPPVETAHYRGISDMNQWWGRQMAICGTHVHVGVDERDKALPMTWTYARFFPYLLALSAASPFWDGTDSGFASQRTMLFQQLRTNGLPYFFATWAEFEKCVEDLVGCGIIDHADELRWDVRPSPKFGTVENRMADSLPTLAELGCQAAVTQCLAEYFSDSLDNGDWPDYLAPWLVHENKWRAARYGLDAEVITPQPGHPAFPLRQAVPRLVERLQPYAERLDCQEELAFALEIIDRGASYERQRRVSDRTDGDLRAVAAALVRETETGWPAWSWRADGPRGDDTDAAR